MSAGVIAPVVHERTHLGLSVPPTPHAISVSLPTWQDNIGYETGEKRVMDVLVNGYPRFFINLSIQKLAGVCLAKFGQPGERCLLLPTLRVADQCRSFMLGRSKEKLSVRLVQFTLCPEDTDLDLIASQTVELHIVLFPADAFLLAKEFWQHTGMGISSRLAEHCLSLLPDDVTPSPSSKTPTSPALRPKHGNRHYSKTPKGSTGHTDSLQLRREPASLPPADILSVEHSTYLEERYGRNLPRVSAPLAKRALRRRIAGVVARDVVSPEDDLERVEIGPSTRGVENVSEEDVYLFPTGMCAVWQAHQLALGVRPPAKSVCFGFPYTDTLKILQKWGPGGHFLGNGTDPDIEELEKILSDAPPSPSPPVLALFTEFPSNPLLRSADLRRLRALADRYDFLIVVDETVGNFVNVEVLPYADIVVSSLTKVFSGAMNVMGGSLILNPKGRHYAALTARMRATYEDALYFDEDALYMERNSRNFRERIHTTNANTEAACDLLRARSLAGGSTAANTAVKEVFFPKWSTPAHYVACLAPGGGFGGLFSLTFASLRAARAFFDALPCEKGPSLGTNFTLACPYTILAHFAELEWAAEYGVEEGLVRVSVGLEERDVLLGWMEEALQAAERAQAAVAADGS